jgi:hypothetical protein
MRGKRLDALVTTLLEHTEYKSHFSAVRYPGLVPWPGALLDVTLNWLSRGDTALISGTVALLITRELTKFRWSNHLRQGAVNPRH